MLRGLGAAVLDADVIYHDLIAPDDAGPSLLATGISKIFPGVLLPDGQLDRPALAKLVFGSTQQRRALEALAHPAVAQETRRRLDRLRAQDCPVAIYDVPLLYERSLESGMDAVIVVWVPQDVQLSRLIARDGISQDDAKQRLAAQLPLDDKRRRADWVIDNSASLSDTRQHVEKIWREIQRERRRPRT